MKFGVAVAAYGELDGERLRDYLQDADELGIYSAWFSDHIAVPQYAVDQGNLSPPFVEPLSACAWGIGVTGRLRFGTDVLVAPYRHPLQVAAVAGTLGQLGGDRFILAVGIGYLRGEFEVLGAPAYERRAEVTEEFLRVVRKGPDGFSVMSAPVPVPLWVGGNGTAAQRRAALLGDGWHPLWMPDADYAAARRRILELRSRHGLSGPFTFSYSCAMTQVMERSSDTWRPLPGRAPAGSEFAYAPAHWTAADGRPRFVGTPDQIVGDLQLLAAAGVDHVTLRFNTLELGPLERFARQVLPAFVA